MHFFLFPFLRVFFCLSLPYRIFIDSYRFTMPFSANLKEINMPPKHQPGKLSDEKTWVKVMKSSVVEAHPGLQMCFNRGFGFQSLLGMKIPFIANMRRDQVYMCIVDVLYHFFGLFLSIRCVIIFLVMYVLQQPFFVGIVQGAGGSWATPPKGWS